MEDKKVWIMTRRSGFNFGSSLQAYAMTAIVDKLGYRNEIINFEEYRLRGKFRLLVFDCLYWFSRIVPKEFIPSSTYIKYIASHNQRKKFKNFEKQYFPLTSRKYKSSASLAKDAAKCAVVICGSDQIWSPTHFQSAFFLDFVDVNTTTAIAYAPSIGINKIDNHKEEIRRLINRIPFISVREERGATIIKELTNRDAPVVLDPTLLLQQKEWGKLVEPTQEKERYILCYFLATNLIPLDSIYDLHEKTGYKLINLITNYSNRYMLNADNIRLSPAEFLGYISGAEFICTNSYHGTIFSILFRKKFFTFSRFRESDSRNQNSRIHTLLENLELTHRLIDAEAETISTQHFGEIDYTRANYQLQRWREFSLQYLRNALAGYVSRTERFVPSP